jgi:hypothetical protein
MHLYTDCLALASSYDLDERDLDQRKLSVESSFKLDLPPHLIVPSASIKLNETIGQGIRSIYYQQYNNFFIQSL